MTMCNKCHYDPCQCDYFDELVYTAADLAIDIDIILKSDQSWPAKVRNIRMACWAARHPNQDPFAAFAKYENGKPSKEKGIT